MAGFNHPNHTNPQEKKEQSTCALLLRVFWMFLGNSVLALSALLIMQKGMSFSPIDILYWLIIPLLIAARYADISWFKGDTAYGEPASMTHWRQYAVKLLLIGAGVWFAAHGAGYLIAK